MAAFQAEHDLANDYLHLYMDKKRSFMHNISKDEINCFLYYNIDDGNDFLKELVIFNKLHNECQLLENNWSNFISFRYKAADYELCGNICCFYSAQICRK